MNENSQINISFSEEKLLVMLDKERVENPLILERIASILGDEQKDHLFNMDLEKYIPLIQLLSLVRLIIISYFKEVKIKELAITFLRTLTQSQIYTIIKNMVSLG